MTEPETNDANLPKVLIIDDSPVDVAILRKILADLECTVEVDDGTGAWNLINTSNVPDLVLLDLIMPTQNGIRLLEHMRTQRLWRDLPVLIISGDAHPTTVHNLAGMGIQGFIAKPYDPERVKHELQRYLPLRVDGSDGAAEPESGAGN